MKKITCIILALVLLLFVVWFFLPSNYYLRQALKHGDSKIDDYTFFENRVVKAASPRPWDIAPDYNEYQIPEKYLPVFEDLSTVAYIIIKDTTILFEKYWDGYYQESLSGSFSVAKSIVSLAIGCALDEGLIKSTDQPVADFFPQFTGYGGKTLTLHHLLTMSVGFDFDETYGSIFSPATKLYYGNNLVKQTFDLKEKEEPGVYFEYQSVVTQLLSFILEEVTGEPISSYVSRKLWTPMHAEEDALWSLDKKEGVEKAFCCYNTNVRDFARFGQLLLNKGQWEGKQLVSSSYLEKALRLDTTLINKTYNDRNEQYGYQFWKLIYEGLEVNYMRGVLGQYVFAIPEKNAVVVRLGHKRIESFTPQHYPEDVDTWLGTALEIIDQSNRAMTPE
ncbi:MAG: beta-lactamase family protein [Bacteroides sp.]|nr:beta-lactamase family protein [Bacteroides sp.]